MPYTPQPFPFVKSSEVQATFDFLDSITGLAFVDFYPAVGFNTGSVKDFFLTPDASFISDTSGYKIATASLDQDFDILVEVPFTVAARDCYMYWLALAAGNNTSTITWKIIHVDSEAAETTLGTITGETLPGGVSNTFHSQSGNAVLTEKHFARGDTIRLNASQNNAENNSLYCDPSGKFSASDGDRTISSQCKLRLPVIPPI